MSDSETKSAAEVPEWQKAQAAPETKAEAPASTEIPNPSTLEQAKIFLKDPEVQKETTERKVEFLKSKGITQSDIDQLLKDELLQVQPEPQAPLTALPPLATAKEDRPPIVTYPEFLTKPVRPPPLMSMNGFLNTLYAFGGVSALIYGTSKYVLEPMVASLTEARISLHDTANQNLTKLVEKLENTVSEIPPTIKKPEPVHSDDDDEESNYDDPTELFHRDVGVQTSIPSSPRPSTANPESQPLSTQQATKLTNLVSSLRAVHDGLNSQTGDIGDIKAHLEAFRDDLDQLSTASYSDFSGGFSYYGSSSRNEPDDEIKKAKENIRRVKGVLLSTRSFPGTVR
ncbi:peroxisomal membrane protein PEX14 [Naviculisporaceae sp. PSN 640]